MAERKQIPIRPAFGMTIHKSQGMTLKRVIIDCSFIRTPGQLGVALGRATCKKELRVLNFDVKYCIKQRESIEMFYTTDSVPCDEGKQCCRKYIDTETDVCLDRAIAHVVHDQETPDVEDEGDFDDIDADTLNNIDALLNDLHEDMELDGSPDIPEFHMENMLSAIKYSNVVTDFHKEANDLVDSLTNQQRTDNFVKKQYQIIKDKLIDVSKYSVQKNITTMYKAINEHQISTLFELQCKQLFQTEQLSKVHNHISFRMFCYIRKHAMELCSQEVVTTSQVQLGMTKYVTYMYIKLSV